MRFSFALCSHWSITRHRVGGEAKETEPPETNGDTMASATFTQIGSKGTLLFGTRALTKDKQGIRDVVASREYDGIASRETVALFASKVIGRAQTATELAPGVFACEDAPVAEVKPAKKG